MMFQERSGSLDWPGFQKEPSCVVRGGIAGSSGLCFDGSQILNGPYRLNEMFGFWWKVLLTNSFDAYLVDRNLVMDSNGRGYDRRCRKW